MSDTLLKLDLPAQRFIELAVPKSFDDEAETTYSAVDKADSISHVSSVGRHSLIGLLDAVREDIKAAHGCGLPGHEIDEEGLDWPDLATTYKLLCKALDVIASEQRA